MVQLEPQAYTQYLYLPLHWASLGLGRWVGRWVSIYIYAQNFPRHLSISRNTYILCWSPRTRFISCNSPDISSYTRKYFQEFDKVGRLRNYFVHSNLTSRNIIDCIQIRTIVKSYLIVAPLSENYIQRWTKKGGLCQKKLRIHLYFTGVA